MKELLKDKEVFELAKKSVIQELEKRYEDFVEIINKKEIERDIAFIKFRIGIISEDEYKNTDSKLLNEKNDVEQGIRSILSKIEKAKEIIQ